MRIHRHHLSRREAERLLDDPAADDSALGTVLAAAGEPAQPDELTGEDAAASEFHRIGMVPSPGGGTTFVPAPRRGGRAAARAVVATGAIVALASGGFALAGSADLPHIPGLPGQGSDRATESVAKDPKPSEASSTSATPGDEASATGGPGTSGSGSPTSTLTETATPGSEEPGAGSSTPTPNYEGLCRAFQATDRSEAGGSLDSAAFTALTDAAGGADRVSAWCVALIGPPKETGPSPTSGPTQKPTGKPTDRPTGKPTGKPTAKPTPSAQPSTSASPHPSQGSGKPSPSLTDTPSDSPAQTGKGGGRNP